MSIRMVTLEELLRLAREIGQIEGGFASVIFLDVDKPKDKEKIANNLAEFETKKKLLQEAREIYEEGLTRKALPTKQMSEALRKQLNAFAEKAPNVTS